MASPYNIDAQTHTHESHLVRVLFSELGRSLLSVLMPSRCAICGGYVDEGCICPRCMTSLPRTEQARLRQNSTEQLFLDLPHVVSAASFLFYQHDSLLRRAVHQMKYASRPEVGYELARQAAREFMADEFFYGVDVIVPVPLHPRRFRQRGYNQSEWIARGLSDETGIPMDTEHLLRAVDNPKQAMLHADERNRNVEAVFCVSHPEELYHKHILLVDDIITTGATIRSCLRTMSAFRGSCFSVFSLGKAR